MILRTDKDRFHYINVITSELPHIILISSVQMLTDSYSNSLFDKNCMWSDQLKHGGFGVFSPFIEKNSRETTNIDTINDDKSIKEELIQAATNRLRQRLLEQRFESFMTQVVELQSRLEMMKMDTASSIKCMGAIENLSEQQFNIFEKRLDTHKGDLDIFLRRKRTTTTHVMASNDQKSEKSSSLSCLSKASFSSLSSMFQSQKSSLNEDESEYDHLGTKPRLRRRKRQQLKRFNDISSSSSQSCTDNSSVWSGSIPEYYPPPPQRETEQDDSQISNKPVLFGLKKSTLAEQKSDLDFISVDSTDSVEDLSIHPYKFHVDYYNTILSSAVSRTSMNLYDQEERNALDDALSFLNDLASDADDGGFGEDIYKLLDLRHSFTPCPLTSGSHIPLSHDIPNKKRPNFILSAIESCIYGSLKWFNFLLVMSIALAITLRRGPSEMSSNMHFQHQMFMNKLL
ncbi:hypothetical protein K501DRAFT_329539 [Backusella circina FSU 941]|nr:hypothetical protein K501DRAFT_329539 [Backusella circina FSU 941]